MAEQSRTYSTVGKARHLRQTMTDGERRLWSELRQFKAWFGLHVRRQAPVGPYIADFLIHSEKLVIEVDGEHHQHPEQIRTNRLRDLWLETQGYRLLRIHTGELAENFSGCIETIMHACNQMRNSKSHPPQGTSHEQAR